MFNSQILAVLPVIFALGCLGYFAMQTLRTSNLFQIGMNLYQQKDYPGAEATLRRVIAINSTNDVVRLLLGDVLIKQEKITEATELLQAVIRNSPENPDAYLGLANIFMEQNQQQQAVTHLQQALNLLQVQRQPERAAKVSQLLEKISAKSL